jgi:hypothetical protein
VLNLLLSAILALTAAGCGPKYSYPADTVPQSVERVAKRDYGLEVTARVVGKTLGALYYVDDILDEAGQIPREIHEQMGKIMQAISRVSLSTDLPLDFCVVVIRDRAHLNELIITRSVDDTKRANSDALGVEESINRTLFGQGKYQPGGQGEKGFILKEVTLEDFLAEQIAQRVRFSFARDSKEGEEESEAGQQSFVLVDGIFNRSETGEKKFRFSVLSLKAEEPRETMSVVLRTMSDVLKGYRFTDYSGIEVLDYLNRQKLEIPLEVMLAYQDKKITEQEIFNKYLTESQTIQEAFKLFGFNLTDTAEAEAPPIAATATAATP